MTILGCTGHQDIPDSAVGHVMDELATAIDDLGENRTGVCSLAVGADQMFAGLIVARQARLHVVVPCRRYESTFGEGSLETYRTLLDVAERVEQLDHPEPSEAAFLAAGQRIVDLCDRLLAVWDGRPARGHGGTADVVAYARRTGTPTTVIWPADVRR